MNAVNNKPSARCPQCRQPSSLEASNRYRPFCSERCKLLDLGEWFAEKHSIPVTESDADPDESPDPSPNKLM